MPVSPKSGHSPSGHAASRANHLTHESAADLIVQGLRPHRVTGRKACVGEALRELMGIFSQIPLED